MASCEGFDQYIIVIDGSRRLTRRNRKFLRRFEPYDPTGRAHRGNNKETTTQANNTEQTLPDNNLDRSRVVRSPSPVVQERISGSPSRALVQREARMETVPVDRSPLRESVEPELIRDAGTEVLENPVINSPRRSTRSNKGQTSRFKDYETDF